MARKFSLQFLRPALRGDNFVIVKKLFARAETAQGMDENAIAFFPGLAIRGTGVIDPASLIPPISCVNYIAVLERKQKRMIGIIGSMRGQFHRLFPGKMFPRVLDDAAAFPNGLRRIHAPAVDAGGSHLNSVRGPVLRIT